jgi:curved DNA-binding protein CbpA
VKAKYKKLAKRHHPDANNGDKKSEEMFKTINLAYTIVSSKFADLLLRTATTSAV